MEPARPRASVVVPTHRGAHRLPELLEALARQDVTEPWELVIVVDGNDPETDAVLGAWTARLPMQVVHRTTSAGVAAALNAGYSTARGEILIRCDDDLTPAPGMIRRHLAHHESSQRVGVIGPTRDVLPPTPYARAYGWAATDRAVAAVRRRDPEHAWLHWAAHNSVRRADLEAVGGMDERFSYREDSDLGLRLARSGVRIIVDPELEVLHRGAAQNARTRVARAWVSGASEVLFAAVHPDVEPLRGPLEPPTARIRAWSAATGAVAALVPDRRAAERAGALVDRLLPALPPTAGGRLVSLAVEGAARAGRRHGGADQTGYRTQKDVELAREKNDATARGETPPD